jgi:hypothetical protein
MTDLQKVPDSPFTQEVLGKLNPIERKIVLASVASDNNPKLKDLNNMQASKAADSILLKASVMLGQKKKEGPEYEILSKTLIDGFFKFPNLTVREIYIATDNGLEGLYKTREDEPVIFNPSNWFQWVRNYIESTKKPAMKKTSQVYKQEEKEALPPSRYDSMVSRYKLLVNAMVSSFESGIPHQDYGGILYDFLLKLEMIEEVDPVGVEVQKAAKWILDNAKDQRDKTKVNHASGILEKVLSGESSESAFAVATRKHIYNLIKKVCAVGEENVIEYLELAKTNLEYYFTENNITKNEY